MLLAVAGFASLLFAQAPGEAKLLLNQGIAAYRNAQYKEAADKFRQAVSLEPSNVSARLYLATAYMMLCVPGADSPENAAWAQQAEVEFRHVLDTEPNNKVALNSLGALSYQQGFALKDREQKTRKLDEAREWYQRVIAVDPRDKVAHYTLGVIAWTKFYPALMEARSQLGMKPEDPGPLPSAVMRQTLTAEWGPKIEEGLSELGKALEIDPEYDDAMAYTNLLMRERADLKDSEDEYKRDVAVADEWVRKALEVKRRKAEAAGAPAPRGDGGGAVGWSAIRVTPAALEQNLVTKIEPVYPEKALQARIQGTVRFTVTVGKDGRVRNLSLVSGHPLLVPAAIEALKQWVYKPTLLNGAPTDVVSEVDVKFTL